MQDTVYVILRETGEYSDRTVDAIRFTLTEEDAQAAVTLAEEESKSKAHLKPQYPPFETTHKWLLPDGTWLDELPWPNRPEGIKFKRLPNADEIEARQNAARAEYYRKCREMGCVDPQGPQPGSAYSYEVVGLLEMRGRQAINAE